MQQKQESLRNQEEKLQHLKEELDHVSPISFCWLWYMYFILFLLIFNHQNDIFTVESRCNR